MPAFHSSCVFIVRSTCTDGVAVAADVDPSIQNFSSAGKSSDRSEGNLADRKVSHGGNIHGPACGKEDCSDSEIIRSLLKTRENLTKMPLWCNIAILPELPVDDLNADSRSPERGGESEGTERVIPKENNPDPELIDRPHERLQGALFYSQHHELNSCGEENVIYVPPVLSSVVPGSSYLLRFSSCHTAMAERGDGAQKNDIEDFIFPIKPEPSEFVFTLNEDSDSANGDVDDDSFIDSEIGIVVSDKKIPYLDVYFSFETAMLQFDHLIASLKQENQSVPKEKKLDITTKLSSLSTLQPRRDLIHEKRADPNLEGGDISGSIDNVTEKFHHFSEPLINEQYFSSAKTRKINDINVLSSADNEIDATMLLRAAMDRETNDLNMLLTGLGFIGILLTLMYAFTAHRILQGNRILSDEYDNNGEGSSAKKNDKDNCRKKIIDISRVGSVGWDMPRITSYLQALVHMVHIWGMQRNRDSQGTSDQRGNINSDHNENQTTRKDEKDCPHKHDFVMPIDGPSLWSPRENRNVQNEKDQAPPQNKSGEERQERRPTPKRLFHHERDNQKYPNRIKDMGLKKSTRKTTIPTGKTFSKAEFLEEEDTDALLPKTALRQRPQSPPSLSHQKRAVNDAVDALFARLNPVPMYDDKVVNPGVIHNKSTAKPATTENINRLHIQKEGTESKVPAVEMIPGGATQRDSNLASNNTGHINETPQDGLPFTDLCTNQTLLFSPRDKCTISSLGPATVPHTAISLEIPRSPELSKQKVQNKQAMPNTVEEQIMISLASTRKPENTDGTKKVNGATDQKVDNGLSFPAKKLPEQQRKETPLNIAKGGSIAPSVGITLPNQSLWKKEDEKTKSGFVPAPFFRESLAKVQAKEAGFPEKSNKCIDISKENNQRRPPISDTSLFIRSDLNESVKHQRSTSIREVQTPLREKSRAQQACNAITPTKHGCPTTPTLETSYTSGQKDKSYSSSNSPELSPCSKLAKEWTEQSQERRRRAASTLSSKPKIILTPPPLVSAVTPLTTESLGTASMYPSIRSSINDNIKGIVSNGKHFSQCGIMPPGALGLSPCNKIVRTKVYPETLPPVARAITPPGVKSLGIPSTDASTRSEITENIEEKVSDENIFVRGSSLPSDARGFAPSIKRSQTKVYPGNSACMNTNTKNIDTYRSPDSSKESTSSEDNVSAVNASHREKEDRVFECKGGLPTKKAPGIERRNDTGKKFFVAGSGGIAEKIRQIKMASKVRADQHHTPRRKIQSLRIGGVSRESGSPSFSSELIGFKLKSGTEDKTSTASNNKKVERETMKAHTERY